MLKTGSNEKIIFIKGGYIWELIMVLIMIRFF